MRIVDSQGFVVRGDKAVEFQRWFRKNQDRIAKAYPKGTSFDGCYVAIYGNEREAGDTYWNVVAESYAALDGLAATLGDPSTELAKIYDEMSRFLDTRVGAGSSRMLLKSVADAAIWDVPAA